MDDPGDSVFMEMAIALAQEGVGRTSPNPTVGCVIVRDGRVVGQGFHEYALKDHAEVRALRDAGSLAKDATLYVTLEPCCHQGRTPPCVDAISRAGIRRVVVARVDPNPHVSGKGIEKLRSCGIQVDVGIMSEEAGALIDGFARWITEGIPLVVGKVGMTLDGKIGTGRPEECRISSPEGLEFGQNLRHRADAILVGVNTVLVDDPELTYRGRDPKARPLIRAILDSQLRTPTSAKMMKTGPKGSVLVFCGSNASEKRQEKLEREGAEVLRIRSAGAEVDPLAVLRELGRRNILEVLVEGGGRVHWSFVSGHLVDKFYFIIAPIVLGGMDGALPVSGKGYETIKEAAKFKVRHFFSVGPDVILETYPVWSRSIISPWLSAETFPSRGQYRGRSSERK